MIEVLHASEWLPSRPGVAFTVVFGSGDELAGLGALRDELDKNGFGEPSLRDALRKLLELELGEALERRLGSQTRLELGEALERRLGPEGPR